MLMLPQGSNNGSINECRRIRVISGNQGCGRLSYVRTGTCNRQGAHQTQIHSPFRKWLKTTVPRPETHHSSLMRTARACIPCAT
jgi:hypothetical protein